MALGTPRALAVSALAVSLVLAARSARADTLRLRVVTYNAWDLEFVSTDRAARIERIGPEIAALAPDLVCFQEVWVDADAVIILRALEKVGLVHARRFASGLVGSGLLVASRFPISDAGFVRYQLGGKPQKPWHGDFYGGKGILRATVETPLGLLDVADTHLHASYHGSPEYDLFKIAEALEAADFLGPSGERPLVFGADLNAFARSLPFRLLAERAGLSRIERDPGIDWILYRDGARLSVRCLEVKKVLDQDVDLGDGHRAHLSDHDGVLAVLELASRAALKERDIPLAPQVAHAGDAVAAGEALALVEAGLDDNLRWLLAFGASGLSALAAGCVLARAAARKLGRARALGAAALAVLAVAALLLALGFLYGPYERRGLLAARARLLR